MTDQVRLNAVLEHVQDVFDSVQDDVGAWISDHIPEYKTGNHPALDCAVIECVAKQMLQQCELVKRFSEGNITQHGMVAASLGVQQEENQDHGFNFAVRQFPENYAQALRVVSNRKGTSGTSVDEYNLRALGDISDEQNLNVDTEHALRDLAMRVERSALRVLSAFIDREELVMNAPLSPENQVHLQETLARRSVANQESVLGGPEEP